MATANLTRKSKGKNYFSRHTLLFWRRMLPIVFFVMFLSVALAACSGGNTASKMSVTPTLAVHPTPTTLPSGTLLYQSDWSHGLDNWQGAAGWKVTHGMLQSDLSKGDVLTSPYTPVGPNYALEVRFQIVSVPRNGGNFIIIADKAPGKDGYTAGIMNLLGPGPHSQFANPEVEVYLDPLDAMASSPPVSDYEPGSGVHTYRIEVQGPQVQFFIDDLRRSSVTSSQNDFLSNGPIHLRADQAVVRVFSVRITVL